MKKAKIDTRGTEEAQRAIAEAQAAANNMSQNFRTDLSTENLTNVVAGGTADAIDVDGSGRKRRVGAGLSSALGIDI